MPAADDAAFADAEIDGLFEAVADRAAIALAVSGGADSLALMLLARRWRAGRAKGPDILVLTVDHGLRPSSADEARAVADLANRFGFGHRTCRWTGPKPTTGIEEAAREARYRLLRGAAEAAGITDILTAHHRGDQAETVLMRLGRGSGLAGLRGMRPERPLGGNVLLHRPLLPVAKSRLAAVVAAAGLTPASDETNADEAFLRPRLRRAMPVLGAAGVGGAAIAKSALRLARADDALEHYAGELLAEAVATDAFATAVLDRSRYRRAPTEVRLRALARVIGAVGNGSWPPPRGDRLEALDAALAAGERFRRTLSGAMIAVDDGSAAIYRECGRMPLPRHRVGTGEAGVWDRRFAYRIDAAPAQEIEIGAVGSGGVKWSGALDAVPRGAVAALPALRIGGEIVAVAGAGTTHPEIAVRFESLVADGLVGPRRDLTLTADPRLTRR